MKSIITFFNIVFDLLQPQPSYDRVSLQMIRFEVPETKQELKSSVVSFIPKDYLYYQVHEIEDDTWNYVASVHDKAVGDDIRR